LRFPRGSLPPQRNAGAWMAEAVRSRFPKLAVALGDAAFETMLAKYMTHEPAARTSVRESGARLASFLASEQYPLWYSELAALDRAHVEVIHAQSLATMGRRDLNLERPLVLVPAHALVDLTTASDELWATLDTIPAGSGTWNRSPRELEWRTVLVWRDHEGNVRDRTAKPDEACALKAAARGTTLGDLYTFFGGANPHATALDAVIVWIDDGILVR